jgi:hypothetical protein
LSTAIKKEQYRVAIKNSRELLSMYMYWFLQFQQSAIGTNHCQS